MHVVDDGSSPPALLDVDDVRVHLHRHDAARGVAAARNAGLEVSTGAWIALLDDDDLWAPRKLERQLAAAAQADAGLVYTATVLLDEQARVLRANPVHPADDLVRDLCHFNAVGEPSSVLVRREAVERAGRFFTGMAILADWDLWLRVVPHTSACAIDEPLTAIVEHAGSMQLDAPRIEAELSLLSARHADLLAQFGATLANADMSLYLAGKRWHGRRNVGATAAYLAAAVRAHGARGAAARLVRRARARRMATPPWVTCLLADP